MIEIKALGSKFFRQLKTLCRVQQKLTRKINAPERCFKTISRLVDGAFSSGFGGGWGGVVPICTPTMASAIKGIRTSDERMELKIFVNSEES